MLLWFVIIYWIISVAIGLYAARWVHNTKDFAVAGRRMPMYIVTATVFATWFGSETVLGIPATFIKDGFSGVIADPFGSSLCLILVGLFFARPLYRMNLLTIGDYYRKRYSRPVEMLTTLCIVISYLGWVGAQIKALGLVFNVVSEGALSQPAGMIIGASTVLVYTMLGGMISVAITAFIPMFLAYSASLIDPKMVAANLEKDTQLILPNLILSPIVPVFAQIMFFGALLSAIKSCASATLLAPSVSFSENILKGFLPRISDKRFLLLNRIVLVCFTILVTYVAMMTDADIY